jgi:hypothetical protein
VTGFSTDLTFQAVAKCQGMSKRDHVNGGSSPEH